MERPIRIFVGAIVGERAAEFLRQDLLLLRQRAIIGLCVTRALVQLLQAVDGQAGIVGFDVCHDGSEYYTKI